MTYQLDKEGTKLVIGFINLLLATKFGTDRKGILDGLVATLEAAGWQIAAMDCDQEEMVTDLWIIEHEDK